tara:strand:- start:266 stop:607 length:342 start_codon:yes stop_codon:yes gene_type:complete
MPKIKNFEKDAAITGTDKLLGTDTSGATKNYLLNDLAAFIVGSNSTFVFEQTNASSTWTINHNLGRFPSVSIKFSSSDSVYTNVQAFAGVTYNNNNTITINLAAAESGFAYLN